MEGCFFERLSIHYDLFDRVGNGNAYQITLDIGHIQNRHLSVTVDIGGSFVEVSRCTDTDQYTLEPCRVEDRDLTVAVSIAEEIARGRLALLRGDRDGRVGIDLGDTVGVITQLLDVLIGSFGRRNAV